MPQLLGFAFALLSSGFLVASCIFMAISYRGVLARDAAKPLEFPPGEEGERKRRAAERFLRWSRIMLYAGGGTMLTAYLIDRFYP